MSSWRVGLGYDVHPLKEGRKLFLAGVHIPYELGLHGHSDGDVLCHALMDSLLGAAGLQAVSYTHLDVYKRQRCRWAADRLQIASDVCEMRPNCAPEPSSEPGTAGFR